MPTTAHLEHLAEFVRDGHEHRRFGDQPTVVGGHLAVPRGRVAAGAPVDDLVLARVQADEGNIWREGSRPGMPIVPAIAVNMTLTNMLRRMVVSRTSGLPSAITPPDMFG
jgi:hypothetical protein